MSDLFLQLIFVFSILIFGISVLNFRKKTDTTNPELENKLSQNFSSQQLAISQIVSDLGNKNQSQLFGIRSEIDKMLSTQGEKTKTEFETLKLQNQQKLNEIQETLTKKLTDNIGELVKINRENFELLNKANQTKLDQINLDVQKRLDDNFAQNMKSFQEVTKNLGQMEQKAQQMIDSTKSIDKLNNIFARTSSKAFGGFAENYLESLLKENLASGTWEKQVKVPGSSEIIDFVIYVDDRKIGIDAKFPLTKYQDFIEADLDQKESKRKEFINGVLEMGKSISEKYYKNGFVDALLLYLPSESLYNEVLDSEKNQQVGEFLQKYKISLTSPNTIFPQILLIKTYQFKLQVSQNAENIVKGLGQIKKNIGGFRDEYRKLGEKIRQAQQNYDSAERNLIGVEKNILLLESEEKVEVEEVERLV